ncbi:Fc receptor-like protein 5, partial [Clarias magur]
GDVILESPLHAVTEGRPLTLHCLNRKTNSSNLRADFYKDGSVLQTQTTGEMIIHKVSKSDEGFYHCKHPVRGESPKSWVSVRSSGSAYRKETVGVTVGLCVAFLVVILIFLVIPLWCYKMKKVMVNAYDTVDCADMSGRDEAAAESREVIYTEIIIKTKEKKNDVDAETSGGDVTYAEIKLKTNICDEIQ